MKEMRLHLGKLIEQKNVLIDNERLYVSEKEEMNVYPIIIDIRCISRKTWYFWSLELAIKVYWIAEK